jgi:hypothetical protein
MQNGSNIYVGDKLELAIARMKYARIQPNNKGIKHEGYALENMRSASKKRVGCYIWITNGTETVLIKSGDILPEGWRKGRSFIDKKIKSHTQQTKDKIAEKNKGDICYNNGIINLKIKNWELPPIGFFKGMIQNHDRVWITDGQTSKVIKHNDDLPIGWRKGRIIKRRNSNE